MVATGFSATTGLTTDPTAQFAPPQVIPDAAGPTVVAQTPEEFAETRRLVGDTVSEEKVWEPSDEDRNQFATLLNCGKRTIWGPRPTPGRSSWLRWPPVSER